MAGIDPRGTVGRINREDHYTMLHTKFESSEPCGFGVEDLFMFSHCKSMGANEPWGGAIFDPRGMVGMIYKEDLYTLLHIKYESPGPCGFGEEDFCLCFSHDAPGAGPVWSQGAWLAGFIKTTTIHCYIQNMKALGLVVSEKKIFFYVFPVVSLWELSVAMETRVLIRPGPKSNTTFSPPQ